MALFGTVPFHVIPSALVARTFVPVPVATKYVPFQMTLYPDVLNIVSNVVPVQVVPLSLYAMVFVPEPTATHLDNVGLYATEVPIVVIPVEPRPVQLIPSTLLAKTLVVWPTATIKFLNAAMP